MKLFIYILFLLTFFLPTPAYADITCGGPYGPQCPSPKITLQKLIKNPVTGEFVETLSSNSPHFLAEQNVTFRLHIQNVGNTDLKNIQVEDKLPDFVDFASGQGQFDSNSRTVKLTVDSLKPGEFRDVDVGAKVVSKSKIPSNNLNCVTNFAQANVDNQFSSDSAVFCIEGQVLAPVQELPKTGPATTLTLFGSALLLLTSAFLFKKARA